jgi:hypothetical protein
VSWRKWFTGRRIQNERAVLERRGVWGDTPETLEWLLEQLQSCTFTNYTVGKAEQLILATTADNVDELIQRLLRATYVLQQLEDVDRYPNATMRMMSLDAFMLTVNQQPIRPEEVVKALVPPLREFLHAMQMLYAEEHARSSYYRRQYGQLMGDLRNLMEQMVNASDHLKV